jgi:hypothetical protein
MTSLLKKKYSIQQMEIEKSTRKHKKYMVRYQNKWIHFGDTRYQQYKDSTPLRLYSHLNHGDQYRRELYLKRATKIVNQQGQLTCTDKNSPNYYSIHFLW